MKLFDISGKVQHCLVEDEVKRVWLQSYLYADSQETASLV